MAIHTSVCLPWMTSLAYWMTFKKVKKLPMIMEGETENTSMLQLYTLYRVRMLLEIYYKTNVSLFVSIIAYGWTKLL